MLSRVRCRVCSSMGELSHGCASACAALYRCVGSVTSKCPNRSFTLQAQFRYKILLQIRYKTLLRISIKPCYKSALKPATKKV